MRTIPLMYQLLLLGACAGRAQPAVSAQAPERTDTSFRGPYRVTIRGYAGDAMEPFMTRDGRWLLFNTRNGMRDQTDVQIARTVDDSTFQYVGPLYAINSDALDAVATADTLGDLYFVSTRQYARTRRTIFAAHLRNGHAWSPTPVPGLASSRVGEVYFDDDLSPDGRTLYLARGTFDFKHGARPLTADLELFVRDSSGAWHRSPRSAGILSRVNTEALEYAPAASPDGHELFFTRLPQDPRAMPSLWVARRADARSPFGTPARIAAATGLVEAVTLSTDGRTIYFHRLVGGRFLIARLVRARAP